MDFIVELINIKGRAKIVIFVFRFPEENQKGEEGEATFLSELSKLKQ